MNTAPTLLWSAGTGGFYLAGISSSIPEDAVEIGEVDHAAVVSAAAVGAGVSACPATGRPIAGPPVPTIAELRCAIRAESRRRILRVSPLWRQINDLRAPSEAAAARFAAIDAIRAASDAIEELLPAADLAAFPVASNPLWPSFGD